MLYIVTYLLIGIVMLLYRNYTHPVSKFYKKWEKEHKDSKQKLPSYTSVLFAAVVVSIALWPISLSSILMDSWNDSRGVK